MHRSVAASSLKRCRKKLICPSLTPIVARASSSPITPRQTAWRKNRVSAFRVFRSTSLALTSAQRLLLPFGAFRDSISRGFPVRCCRGSGIYSRGLPPEHPDVCVAHPDEVREELCSDCIELARGE